MHYEIPAWLMFWHVSMVLISWYASWRLYKWHKWIQEQTKPRGLDRPIYYPPTQPREFIPYPSPEFDCENYRCDGMTEGVAPSPDPPIYVFHDGTKLQDLLE